jgi:hypothetical protein
MKANAVRGALLDEFHSVVKDFGTGMATAKRSSQPLRRDVVERYREHRRIVELLAQPLQVLS